MSRIFQVLGLAAAIALALPGIASSADKKTPPPTETKPSAGKEDARKDHYPLYGEVVAISATLLTVKGGKDKPDRKFDITKTTKITKDGKEATTKDATVGQWVGGYVKRSGGKGNDELVSLNLSAKQKEDKKTDEKKPETTTPPKKK